MSSTAANVAVGMEIIAAMDLFYNIQLNAAVAIFQIFATQMLGYGVAGILRNLLVYPTYAFYPTYISVVNLLQSLHGDGTSLNQKKRRFFWIVFVCIFCWEWIPQYAFPLLVSLLKSFLMHLKTEYIGRLLSPLYVSPTTAGMHSCVTSSELAARMKG